MTFPKTSLALLLALPLAATAADSPPPPPEPAGFIPGIPVLQAAKDVFLTQAKAENPPPASAAPPPVTKKMRMEDFPDVAPFEIPGQVKKPVVQNECSDFTPVKNVLDLMAQLYNHMEYACMRDPNTNNLETLLGIPVITIPNDKDYQESIKIVDDYSGKFYLTQSVGFTGEVFRMDLKISKHFSESGGNIFEYRLLPTIPPPERTPNLGDTADSWEYYEFNAIKPPENFGQYSAKTFHTWRKGEVEMQIGNWTIAGSERFHIYFY